MAETMKFKSYRTNHPNLYPSIIPDDLQGTINDWFDNRYVNDDEMFDIYFRRVLNRDYHRYEQLLRIEPGISDYDWMVTQYQEHMTYGTVTGSQSNASAGSTIGERSVDNKTSVITDGNTTGTNTDNSTQSTTGTETGTGSTTSEQTTEYGGTEDNSTESNKTSITAGTTSEHGQDTTTVHNKDTSKTTVTDNSSDGVQSATAGMPNSLVYSSAKAGSVPELSWKTMSSQAGSDSTHEGTSITDATDSTDGTTTLDKTNSTTNNNKVTDTGSDSNHTEHGGSDIVNGNTSTNDSKTTSGETTSTTNGTNEGTSHTTSDTNGNSAENSSTKTESSGSTDSKQSTKNYDISSGRNDQIALVLENAMSFIKSSSAWAWLQARLEVCFMGVYDV